MLTTVPFKSVPGLGAPVTDVMPRAVVALPAAGVAPTATLADAMTVFIATGAGHILVAASAAEPPIGVIGESDLVAFMAG
jgi:hypothetical protein